LRERLLPLTDVVTPNLAEARVLAQTEAEPTELAKAIHALGAKAVAVTGGHRENEATDVFFDGDRLEEIPGERHESGAAHGSGCTHSSALAAHLALGAEPLEAARKAKELAARAVADGLSDIGEGAGPVNALGRLA
jgi:hydroxymethylpyrimidine/phosphomethylpyrimidine kinase